jgi:tetratricopeptide (TPR) repeat protein
MSIRAIELFVLTFCLSCAAAFAQERATPSTAPTPGPRSHVERFSSPQALAARAEAESTAKIKANPSDAEALNSRAYARMGLGRYQEAVEDLRRAVAIDPNRADYHANLGYAFWKTGRRAEALDSERTALKLDDKNFTAHFQLGRFLLLSGDKSQLAEAARHLRRALELDPRRSEIRFDLLTIYRTLNDQPNAIAQLNLLQDARPADPRVTYADALLASDRNDLTAAVRGFRETLRLDPTLHGAWQDLGLAFIKLKRWPDAVETFTELARRQSDSVEAAYFHALSLFNVGRIDEAERESRRALRLDAGAAAAHTLLGIILASRGGADAEASDVLSQAIALDPNSFDAHFYLGRVQYAMSDFAAAAKSLRAAVSLNQRHSEARFFLGTSLESAGESDAAFAEYQKLVEMDQRSAIGQVGLGALQVKQGKIDEAIATLKRAIALDAKIFEAHWALGRALALNERFPEAIESLRVAVTLLPERADAHYQLGLALRRAGRVEEARAEFATVERLNAEFRTRALKN